MTPAQVCHASAELDLVHQRRKLFFWTINKTLALIVLATMTIAFVASMIQDVSIDAAQIAAGAAIMAASAGNGHARDFLRRLGCREPPA